MSESLSKLQNVKVERSLKNFKDGAVGSIEMLSVGFYGIIEAFKDEMQKSRDIEEKIEKSFEDISSLKEDLNFCNEKCVELNNKLNDEMKKIKKCLSSQSEEVDKKLLKMKEIVNTKCDSIKKECFDAVETISNKVGSQMENVDRLKEQFEALEQETNDQIRSLSMRCEENKELIEAQEGKFGDQLKDLTEILHHKALELDQKIENALIETTEKINQFDEKQQMFQFETNKELSQKADIEDLKRKLDINQYQQFVEKTYNNFTEKMNENIQLIETNINNQETKQKEFDENITTINAERNTFKLFVSERFNELQSAIENPVDIDSLKQEISQQILEDQEAFKEEMIALIKASAKDGGVQPSFGTQSGNCIACGRGPSSFQPLPGKSPSPQKKPKHGGGFNRLPSRRRSMDMRLPNREKFMKSCGSNEDLANIKDKMSELISSPKTPNQRRKSTTFLNENNKIVPMANNTKVIVENEPVRVKIPDIND